MASCVGSCVPSPFPPKKYEKFDFVRIFVKLKDSDFRIDLVVEIGMWNVNCELMLFDFWLKLCESWNWEMADSFELGDLPELEETPEFLELLELVDLPELGDLPELENLETCLELEKTMSEIDISECYQAFLFSTKVIL